MFLSLSARLLFKSVSKSIWLRFVFGHIRKANKTSWSSTKSKLLVLLLVIMFVVLITSVRLVWASSHGNAFWLVNNIVINVDCRYVQPLFGKETDSIEQLRTNRHRSLSLFCFTCLEEYRSLQRRWGYWLDDPQKNWKNDLTIRRATGQTLSPSTFKHDRGAKMTTFGWRQRFPVFRPALFSSPFYVWLRFGVWSHQEGQQDTSDRQTNVS